MKQSGLTYVMRACQGAALDKLKHALTAVNEHIHSDRESFSERHPRLHYTSFLLVERNRQANDPVDLIWEVNCDGPPSGFVEPFVKRERSMLTSLFRHCEGGPGEEASASDLLRFLHGKNRGWSAFYVAFPGKSVQEIKQEARLRDFVRDALDGVPGPRSQAEPPTTQTRRARLYLEIKRRLANHSDFSFLRNEPPQLPFSLETTSLVKALKGVGLALGAVGNADAITELPPRWEPVLWIAGGLGAIALSPVIGPVALIAKSLIEREPEDPVEAIVWDPERIEAITVDEDPLCTEQNHLTHITKLKPGWFRERVAKLVFFGINLLARIWFTRGQLGGINSIHFARWTVLPDGWVVFMSNYDGSWASYLGDFVDRASEGLTGVWSNTHDFPQTSLLFWGGANDEQRFLAFGRNHQERNWVWFSAYPDLSVANIQNNAALRRELGRIPCAPPEEPKNCEREFWLPLSEAQLDAWFRRA